MVDKIKYIVNVLIVMLLFATVAIQKDGRIIGYDVKELVLAQDQSKAEEPVEITTSDGVRVINSATLARDVVGFGGRTPVKLYVSDNVVTEIEVAPNAETPSFYQQVLDSPLFDKWIGESLTEIATAQYDAVSGATYTSQAIITNVQRAAQYGSNVAAVSNSPFGSLDFRTVAGLLVILLGAVITLAKIKNKRAILALQVLNVVVLGFWCGSFLSLTTFTSWAANGFNFALSLVSIAVFLVILIMPLLGKKGTYCQMHCPMGSAQELMGRIPSKKLKFGQKTTKFLNSLRYYILAVMLFFMWVGAGFELMNYEVFSAFIIESASVVVLIMAVAFLVLSVFTPRPYCRFVCPTGAILTISQKTK